MPYMVDSDTNLAITKSGPGVTSPPMFAVTPVLQSDSTMKLSHLAQGAAEGAAEGAVAQAESAAEEGAGARQGGGSC